MRFISIPCATLAKALIAGLLCCFISSLTANAANLSTIYTFNAVCDGQSPAPGLVLATDGNFYGTTSSGGTNDDGTIYKMTPSGTLTTLHSFTDAKGDGAYPAGNPIQAVDGKIYGAASGGGAYNGGIIWCWDPIAGAYSIVKSFLTTKIYSPSDGLVQDSSGILYGEMSSGGTNGSGGIYKISANGSGFTVLGQFSVAYASSTPLVLDNSNSTLYGLGPFDYGVLYSVRKGGGAIRTMYSFSPSSPLGFGPSGLCLGSDGKLYISVYNGGTAQLGAIESMATGATTPKLVYGFTNTTDGEYPQGSLTSASNGVMYGTASFGGIDQSHNPGDGVVFSVTTAGAFTAIGTLPGTGAAGQYANGGVTIDGASELVSTCTDDPESRDFGDVIETATSGGVPSVLHDFFAAGSFSGANPYLGGLTYYTDGNYYGTTYNSEPYSLTYNSGTIFQMTPSGQVTFPYFFGVADRSALDTPYSAPIVGFDGNLVGVTGNNFGYGIGALYDFEPSLLSLTDICTLNESDGESPTSNVVEDTNGYYYFTTVYGGANSFGALIRVNSANGVQKEVYSFTGGSDGYSPYGCIAPLTTKNGTIYGTCEYGGAGGGGTAWSWNSVGGLKVLASFTSNSAAGWMPEGLIKGTDGLLYGTLNTSNPGGGAIYQLAPSGLKPPLSLHTFASATDGSNPANTAIEGLSGLLYGTCGTGGKKGAGTIWQIGRSGHGFTVLGNFADDGITTGGEPYGLVTQGQDGNLYGTTYEGGIAPYPGTAVQGTIYKLTLP